MIHKKTNKQIPGRLANEKGMVLFIAMIMLFLFSLLGAMALSTSTTEIDLSGNYKKAQLAFYTADSATEYAHTDGVIYAAIIPGTVDMWPASTATGADIVTVNGQKYKVVTIDDGIGTTPNYTAQVRVTYLTTAALPPGSGSDADQFVGNYYICESTGAGPNGTTAKIESEVARVVPK